MLICLSTVIEILPFIIIFASDMPIKGDLSFLSSVVFSNSKDHDLCYLCNFETFGTNGTNMQVYSLYFGKALFSFILIRQKYSKIYCTVYLFNCFMTNSKNHA